MKKKGFTLIELIIVVTIIGLLVTVASVSYNKAQAKTRDNIRKNDLVAVANALAGFYQDNQVYPSTPNPTANDGTFWRYTDFQDGGPVQQAGDPWSHQSPYVPNTNGPLGVLLFETVYIRSLPHDPYYDPATYNYNGYMYQSNGISYTLWSFNAVEAQKAVPSTDDFFVPGTGSWIRSYRVTSL